MTRSEIEGYAKTVQNAVEDATRAFENGRQFQGEEIMDVISEATKGFTDKIIEEQDALGVWSLDAAPKWQYTTEIVVSTSAKHVKALADCRAARENTPDLYLMARALETVMAAGGFPEFKPSHRQLSYKDEPTQKHFYAHRGFRETLWKEAYRLSYQTNEYYSITDLCNYLMLHIEELVPEDYHQKANRVKYTSEDVIKALLKA